MTDPPVALRELQALFMAAIRYPTGIDAFVQQASPAQQALLRTAIVDTPSFSRNARLTVYAESYYWRLAEVLGQQYRVVAWLVGPPRFHNLVTDFVWACPSTSRDVRRFGKDLPDYIAAHPIARQVVGLEDLARVERAIVEALDAPDVDPIGPALLHARPIATWPAMRFHAAPWVRLLASRRSYPRAYAARDAGQSPACPVPAPDGRTHWVLVWRQDLEVLHRSVPAAEARALAALLRGETFERICAAAARSEDGDPAGPPAVVAWLQQWLHSALLCGVT